MIPLSLVLRRCQTPAQDFNGGDDVEFEMNFSIEYFVRHEESKLLRESKTPGTLTYKRSFVCDQCGKIRSCFGEGSGRS